MLKVFINTYFFVNKHFVYLLVKNNIHLQNARYALCLWF